MTRAQGAETRGEALDAQLAPHPSRRDAERPPALAELLECVGLGRLDQIGHEFGRPPGGCLGVWRQGGWNVVHLTQAERQICDMVRALALPLPGFSQLREECVVRGEISLFDDLASVLRGLQLAHPHRDQVARACEKFGVRRVGTARFLGLFLKECTRQRQGESVDTGGRRKRRPGECSAHLHVRLIG